MRLRTGATQSGASTSISPRNRERRGCAISASPIQFGATTRIRGTNALLPRRPYRDTESRSTGSASFLPSPRRGTRADAAPRAASPASGSGRAGPSRLLRLLYWCQPCAVLLVLSGHHVEERLLDRFRHRAGLAGADDAAVELADRRHLRRGAGEEALVGDVDVVARQALRPHLVAEAGGELDHRGAGDARERRSQLGLPQHAVFHDEDVLARAFRDEAVDVEQQALIIAVLGRLQRRQHRVR